MKIENIKAFVKRDRDAVMIEEMGELVPHYFYGDDHKVYELNAMTCLLIITGKSELIKTVRPIATEDGDVEWTMENDLIGGYYKDEHDNKVPVMDKNVVAYINNDNELVILDYSFVNRSLEMMSNTYVTLDTWSKSHGKSVSAAKRQCQLGRVRGAVQVGGLWLIPEHTPYPERVSNDVMVLERPEGALSDLAYEFLNQCMLNGLHELPCGIKINPYADNGVRLSIELPNWLKNYFIGPRIFEYLFCGFVDGSDSTYVDEIGKLIPTSIVSLIDDAISYDDVYNKINIAMSSSCSIDDEFVNQWIWTNDEYNNENMFLKNHRDYITIIEYLKVLNYYCETYHDVLFNDNSDVLCDTLDNPINKLNVLFLTTEDPIVLSCLTNVESFKEHMDELLK